MDPTFWTPVFPAKGKPRYLGIADAIAEDIRTGRLAPADRLPPQRVLAEALDIDFTTVARGYVEAKRRGLIESRVGQGTFVRADAATALRPTRRRHDTADLSMNLPPEPADEALKARMAATLAEIGPDLLPLLRYQGFGGMAEDKQAALAWLGRRDLAPPPDRLLITPGAHPALLATLVHLARPGDTILAEELTYPGIRALAAQLGLKLIGVPMDDDGLDAAALAEIAHEHRPRALYLNPTLLNPTTTTIPLTRREAIVAVARRFDLPIVEDDAYAFVPKSPPPAFAALAPDITFHVAGLAKCLGAGLRLAYVVAPDVRTAWSLAAAMRTATVMASPLTAAIATRWIETGVAEEILAAIRRESAARQAIAAALLPRGTYRADAEGFHLWLSLPPPWTRAAFVAQMRPTGLSVVPGEAFAVGEPPEAVRVCLGGSLDREAVGHALAFMATALAEAPQIDSAFL